jgi:class 3 adenylate cyclase
MIRFAQLVCPGYNIYRRLGLTEGMPVSNQNAAQRIVIDMIQDGFYVEFVEALIRIDAEGYMGRRYALRGLTDVVSGLIQTGYNFDKISGRFFENQNERITANWGRLQEGDERRMTALRLDIVGNSVLVKENPREKINKAYKDLRAIVERAVIKRLGRLWSWEGDGALGVFMLGSIEKMAVYAGMEILHELFFYNRLDNPLGSPIAVRIAVHIGVVLYSGNVVERLKSETIKQAVALESKAAAANSMAVSYNLFMSMDQSTMDLFTPEKIQAGIKFRLYSVGVE